MKINWASFRQDRYFFLKYFSLQLVIFLGLFALVYSLRGPLDWSLYTPYWPVLLPLAFVAGIKIPVVLHNAVHENFQPRRRNEVIGEVAGAFVLFGMAPFRISHILHHAHADSEMDPHPPNGRSFAMFLLTTQLNSIRVIRRKFLDYHGERFSSHAILIGEMGIYYLGILARVAFWVWLLGPALFVTFFVPAWLTNLLVFAHINFATHKTMPDGSVEMLNLNGNGYYRLVNFLGDGAYFHANHHRWQKRINPMRADSWRKPNLRTA